MNEELDAKLVAKYPLIFKNRHGNMKETLMCWGFECGDGWYNIIDTLCGALSADYNRKKERYDNLIKWKAEFGTYPWKDGTEITDEAIEEAKKELEHAEKCTPVADQVKEKFGGLRFYVNSAMEKHYHYIDFAEQMSYKICEQCGAAGTYYPIGWHQTLCDKHADENYLEHAKEYRLKIGLWAEENE